MHDRSKRVGERLRESGRHGGVTDHHLRRSSIYSTGVRKKAARYHEIVFRDTMLKLLHRLNYLNLMRGALCTCRLDRPSNIGEVSVRSPLL
jgi:hypothetical protein